MKRFLSLLMAMLLCCAPALAEVIEDYPVATVNGEKLMFSRYTAIESAYLYQYEIAGVDLTDESMAAYLKDLAMSYAIEQMLVEQDMRAQGCYIFDEETEAWFVDSGKAAYEQALLDVMDSMRSPETSEDELEVYALAYAETLGVTEQTYVDFFRTQYAQENYRQWLIRDNPVTDEAVLATYDEYVAQSIALYENDVPAFETALTNGTAAWYVPAGYRQVLQLLLPAQGETDEEKLASVQATLDDIYARLENGESFQSLIALYGADVNLTDESMLATGYAVHQDSIVWADAFVEAAFSEEMAAPGSVSKPVINKSNVHILYYLSDMTSGPIELTGELQNMLAASIYQERYTAAQKERLNELAAVAQVVFH